MRLLDITLWFLIGVLVFRTIISFTIFWNLDEEGLYENESATDPLHAAAFDMLDEEEEKLKKDGE